MNEIVLFFGCWDEAGHYLKFWDRRTVRDFDADRMMVPHAGVLDGSFLFLPRPEKVGNGALTYLPATNRTILAWWGSPWDGRGAVNSAIIVSGKATSEECWRRFMAAFPDLARRLTRPLIVAGE
jgi:hypothetical protein